MSISASLSADTVSVERRFGSNSTVPPYPPNASSATTRSGILVSVQADDSDSATSAIDEKMVTVGRRRLIVVLFGLATR